MKVLSIIFACVFFLTLDGCTGGQWKCREFRSHWFEDPIYKVYTEKELLLEPYKRPYTLIRCGWEADGYPYHPNKQLNQTHWRYEDRKYGF